MKKFFLLNGWITFLLLLVSCSGSDDPTPDPDPEPEPPVVIVEGVNLSPAKFEATEGATITFKAGTTSQLYGHTGDVYAHIGVVEGSNWLYVPAEWDQNIAKCKMTKVENNVWSLALSPDIRSWFGVAQGVVVQKIGIILRSADGTKKGLADDYFISVNDDSFTPTDVVLEAQPSGTEDGINVTSPTSVTLVLYDKDKNGKRKDHAYVIGDFNDWKVNNDYQMKRDEATGCWWYTLTGLQSNKEYSFQYYLMSEEDGILRIADPYTEKVLDPYNDKYISASTYPNIPAYPEGKTFGMVSTFQTVVKGDEAPQFFKVEDKQNLVIYEILLRDFTQSGDINGAIEKLDYLKAMGVNAIELMPVQEFDGNDSWGYNPCFYFAMDKAYGTKEAYLRFIDECHSRGMAVILDVVYNHATGSHPFAQLYWNAKKNETAANNPWFNVEAPHPYNVFHDFNHESPLVRKFVKRNLQFLLKEYGIDGFRFDLTKGFTQRQSDESSASNYDGTRVAILKDYNAAIKEVHPDAIVILEHFAVELEEKELAQDGMMLWRNANYAFCQMAMGWSSESSLANFTTDGTTMPFGGWIGFMESHDEERMAYKQTAHGNYNLKTDLTARMKQLEVNSAICFAIPGPKMIWQFGELGYDISIEENGRTGKKPLKWDYLTVSQRKSLYDTYCKLITLRTQEHPDLFTDATNMVWKVATSDWNNGRYVSLKGVTGKGLVVIGNFTNQPTTCSVNFQSTGTWTNYLAPGQTLAVNSVTQSVTIPAHSFYVYVKE
ncbi:alpha-amylase [Bacteroides sp. OttesenSCG-928-J23]|nr:alpha-amylase [Bacteroides sp. OttesenSCG-928-J23]